MNEDTLETAAADLQKSLKGFVAAIITKAQESQKSNEELIRTLSIFNKTLQ